MLLLEMRPNQKQPSSYHLSPSCCAQVVRMEIAWLELEIMHLERHLLSRYRKAYQQHHHHLLVLPAHDDYDTGDNDDDGSSCPPEYNGQLLLHPCIVKEQEEENVVGRHRVSHNRNLADHLGFSSCSNSTPTPNILSEDIVKCISCIYYKLGNPVPSNHIGIGIRAGSSNSSASSTSLSSLSSSTFYPGIVYDDDDKSSPRCKRRRPYYGAIQVSNISYVDTDETFHYAVKMLEKFRSLVKRLEKVNPTKMKREEKLAFWINIHNALVMHAHLAYGTQNRMKSSSILKAAYNVGGHCINAYIIQSTILGIHSHYSLPLLQTLLSPGKKFKTESMKHEYAIGYPEPLVHFALCSGAYSDPAVRMYRAKDVFNDLKLAKEEFSHASIHVHKETKLVLPKIFSFFAKDMSLDVFGLFKVVRECLPREDGEWNAVANCLNGSNASPDKNIHWLPQSSAFRYIIHRQLAQEIISSL